MTPLLFDEARAVLGPGPVDACVQRLRAPLRIALAGTLKAGKSTLLNALLGADVAPADATECTRLVARYRWADRAVVYAVDPRGVRTVLRTPQDVPSGTAELEIGVPQPMLRRFEFVDTPGTSSATRHVSARTLAYLDPDDGVCPADAVVHLTTALHDDDVTLLARIQTQVGRGGPVALIGVLSRADEHRPDPNRTAADPRLATLPREFLPVSGHLALRARCLHGDEFAALAALADRPDSAALLVSPGRFLAGMGDDRLLETWGMHGLETAVELLRAGHRSPAALAAALLHRSGITVLTDALENRVAQRTRGLRRRAALRELRTRVDGSMDLPGAAGLLTRIDTELAGDATLAELRALGTLPGATLPAPSRVALHRLLGGSGTTSRTRLGLSPDAATGELRATATRAAAHWRSRLDDPLLDPYARAAVRVAVRSAEAAVVG